MIKIMKLCKLGISLAEQCSNYTKALGKSSIMSTKPVRAVGLKYARNLEHDEGCFFQATFSQVRKDADSILDKLKRLYSADYIEERCPDIVENVAKNNITTQGELTYKRYKLLELFSKESPETFVLLGNTMGSPLKLQTMIAGYGDTIRQIAKETPIDEIKDIFSEIDLFALKNKFKPQFEHYMNMLIMKKYNPQAYEYIMKTKDVGIAYNVKDWGRGFGFTPSARFLKTITPEQIRAMTYDCLPAMKNIGAYVDSSDEFIRDTKAVQELSEDLSKHKLSSDVTLFRGERHVGKFDKITVDKDFEQQIRELLERNKDKALKIRITEYQKSYSCAPSTNLYDFLSSKENLTLADAMQVAKYGDDKFINSIIQRIQKARIIDNRFKSLSFDEGMASGWKGINAGDNTTILQKARVLKGTEGGYHHGPNAQYEVILNNTPKELTFNDVVYNKDNDTFELQSVIHNV